MASTTFSIGVSCIYINDLTKPIHTTGFGLKVTKEMKEDGEKTEVVGLSFRTYDLEDSYKVAPGAILCVRLPSDGGGNISCRFYKITESYIAENIESYAIYRDPVSISLKVEEA